MFGLVRSLQQGGALRFVKDTFTTFSAQITSVLLGMAATVVVARALGPSGNGVYSLVVLVSTFLTLLGNLGIGSANLYYGGKRRYDYALLASNSVFSALALGLLVSVLFLAYFFACRPSFLSEVDPLYVAAAVGVLPLSLLTSYLASILLGQGRIRQYNLLQVMPRTTSLLLMLVLLLGFGAGMLGVVVAWVCGVLITAVLSMGLVFAVARIRRGFDFHVFKDSLRFGVQGYLGNVVQFMNYRVDMVMVAYFMGASDVGYYSISVAMAEALWYFPAAVGTNVVARTPRLTDEEANRTTPRICRTTFFITLLAALSLFGLSRYVVLWFYGSEFLPAVRPFWYLLPGVVALSICKVLSNELTGRGKPWINTAIAVVSLAVNVPLNMVLIPRMGIAGASLSSTVSYFVTAIVTLMAFMRVSGKGWSETIVVRVEDLRLYAGVLGTLANRIRVAADGSRD